MSPFHIPVSIFRRYDYMSKWRWTIDFDWQADWSMRLLHFPNGTRPMPVLCCCCIIGTYVGEKGRPADKRPSAWGIGCWKCSAVMNGRTAEECSLEWEWSWTESADKGIGLFSLIEDWGLELEVFSWSFTGSFRCLVAERCTWLSCLGIGAKRWPFLNLARLFLNHTWRNKFC